MTPIELVAFRRRRELGGNRAPIVNAPRSAPAPKIGPKRSMIGYIDQTLVAYAICKLLAEGDRDPTTYGGVIAWLNRTIPEAIKYDVPTRSAILNDPRVRAVLRPIGLAAVALAEERRSYAKPDPSAPTTLGWRLWVFNREQGVLCSPSMGTAWPTPELRVETWEDSKALRGVAGIHALRVPVDPRRAVWPRASGVNAPRNCAITGIVERFGRYVLGTEGWRAEWVIIRSLRAPSTKMGLALEQVYPDVEVWYEDR